MQDGDVLENNPHITAQALAAIHDDVFCWALSRCRHDRMMAEDLVQQAYVELLSGKARFDGRSSLKTFVFSVVQNLAGSRLRRLATRLRFVQAQGAAEPVREEHVEEEHRDVWGAVQALPDRQRDIVELVFCRELTVEQSAVVMGVSTGTARTHYDRAKKALRRHLEADNG